MNQNELINELINLIKTKTNWDSKNLVKAINEYNKKQINIKFCYIGGYELLQDGTKTEVCESLEDIQSLLDDWDIHYDESIKDPLKLAKRVQREWKKRMDGGGGSGWIEFK